MSENQIVVYHPNETVRLDVRLENETVWLNRHQMAQLFGRDVKTVGKHVANALKEELSDLVATEHSHGETSLSVVAKSAKTRKGNVFPTVAKFATVQNEGGRQIVRQVEYYNLDVILSVGYRVKSPQGILFRRWANTVLKEYLLRGYSFNTRLNQLEDKIDDKELYLVGASLKDLGAKCFAFTKLDSGEIPRIKRSAFNPADAANR